MAGSTRRVVGWVTLGVLLLVAGSMLMSAWRRWNTDRETAQELRYQNAIAAAASLRVAYDSVVKASKIDSKRLDSLKAQSIDLKKQIDSRANSARLKGVQIDGQPLPESDTDPRWKELYLQRTEQNAENERVIAMYEKLHTIDASALLISTGMTQRWEGIAHTAVLSVVPNLTSVAMEQHDRRDCSILRYIPCPSRKVSAAVAGVTGTVLGAVLAGKLP